MLKKLDFIFACTEASEHFEGYLNETLSAEKFLSIMTREKNTSGSTCNQGLSQVEKLTLLRDSLPNIVARMELDLVTLSRKCSKLLQLIRAAFKTRLGIENMENGNEFGGEVELRDCDGDPG